MVCVVGSLCDGLEVLTCVRDEISWKTFIIDKIVNYL